MGYGTFPLEQQLAMVQAEQGNVGAFGEIGRKWQASQTALETAEGQLTKHANRVAGAWQDDAGRTFLRRTDASTTSLRTHAQRIAAAAPWTALDAAAQAVPMVAQYVAQCLEQARQIQAAAGGASVDSQVKQLQEAAGAKMDELGRLYVAAAQRLRAAAGENAAGAGAAGGGAADGGGASGADGGAEPSAGGAEASAAGAGAGGADASAAEAGLGGADANAAGAGAGSGGAEAQAAGGAAASGAGVSSGAGPGAVPTPEAPKLPDLPSPVAPTLAGLESVAPPVPPSVTPIAPTLPPAAGVPSPALGGGLAGLAGSVRLPGASAIPQVAVPRATTVTPAAAVAPGEPVAPGTSSAASARPSSGGFPGMMPPMSGALTGSGQRPGPGRAENPFTGRGPARRQPPGVPERLGGRAGGDRRATQAEEPRWSPDTPRLDDELWEVAPPPSPLRSDRA